MIEKQSGRCKIQDIERFRVTSHWVINRWWARDERNALGADELVTSASRNEIDSLVGEFNAALMDYDQFISTDALDAIPNTAEITLGNKSLFNLFIGTRVLKKNVSTDTTRVPVYSANVFAPMGFIEKSNITDFDYPSILWGIDGNFDFNLVPAGYVFASTDHCGVIQILDPTIVPEYLLYALNLRRIEESFDRSFRASLANMRQFTTTIPTDKDGNFDVKAQTLIAAQFTGARQKKEQLEAIKEKLDSIFDSYLASKHLGG